MIKKTISEYGQIITTAAKPELWRSNSLEIRDKDGRFIATLSQSYTGSVTLISGQGYELKESEE